MIDFHVHVYPPEIIKNAEKISSREPYFNALTHNKVHRWATVDELLSTMTENGVTLCDFRLCVSGFRIVPDLQ